MSEKMNNASISNLENCLESTVWEIVKSGTSKKHLKMDSQISNYIPNIFLLLK